MEDKLSHSAQHGANDSSLAPVDQCTSGVISLMLGREWLDVLEQRFLRYVRIDTQSQEDSLDVPSTACQLDLLRVLAEDLRELGALDVVLDDYGYVTATVPATVHDEAIPTVAFLAHVDTAPDFCGSDVRPIVHRSYGGAPIRLPDNPDIVISEDDNPDLPSKQGEDIVTASGTTLLGADDKAGVAIVVTLVDYLLRHAALRHGRIRLCFTPDEEIGRGVDHLSLRDLDANVAYTVDGGELGEIVFETFSADLAVVTIEGVAIHPGDAKGRMVNAIRLSSRLLERLPTDKMAPETTEGYEGFIHPLRIAGDASRVEMRFLLRDFELEGLAEKGALIQRLCAQLQEEEPRSKVQCDIRRQYRNMRYWLENDRRPVDLAISAAQQVSIVPRVNPTRGGTDGSRLTEMGLPTPNLFTGAHNMHGPKEWVSVQDMARSLELCAALVQLWEQDGRGYVGWRE
jgi:tripeptide aminopeptidase